MQALPKTMRSTLGTDLTRRRFLRTSVTTSAGLTGILLTQTPPAHAQERELKLLTFAHFVPTSDEELQRQLTQLLGQ